MYAVRFVNDDQLPEGQPWVMARLSDGDCVFFVKRQALSPRVLEEAWAGYRALVPRQKVGAA